jgi:hypothetical protein
MIRHDLRIRALSPLSHFSDETGSNVRTFRRMNYALPEPETHASKFATPADRRRALGKLLYYVYTIIPTDRKTTRIWTEFEGKLKACAAERTRHAFISRLLDLFGAGFIKDAEIIRLLDSFDDHEFMTTVRDELSLLISEVYLAKEHAKEMIGVDRNAPTLFGEIKIVEPELSTAHIEKTFEEVPVISGNAVRGTLRDLMAADWCDLTGYGPATGDTLPIEVFHQLFTGGAITESSDFEDLDIQRRYAKLIPPVGLLGTAIGNGTIQGTLACGFMHLRCKENGRGPESCHSLVEHMFFTRSDKSGEQYDYWSSDTEPPIQQMIWHQEAIIAGAEFDQSMILTNADAGNWLAYNRMLWLWKQSGIIGGQAARGFGEIDIDCETLNWQEVETLAGEYAEAVKEQSVEARAFVKEISSKRGTKAVKEKKGK